MAYLNDQILKSLREARQRKGLSQRVLSAKSGVPQSHISKIEKGNVDLRVSSLIALARVLDLELELVPKKSVPAIKSIVRSSANSEMANAQKRFQQEIERYKHIIASIPEVSSISSGELEKLKKAMDSIEQFKPSLSAVKAIESSREALEKAVRNSAIYPIENTIKPEALEAIRKATRNLNSLRNALAHQMPAQAGSSSSPAYSLDGGDDE